MELLREAGGMVPGLEKMAFHSVAGAALSRRGISCANGCLSLLSRVGTFRLVPSFSQHSGAPRLIP